MLLMEHALKRIEIVTPEVADRCEKAAEAYLDAHADVWEAATAKHADFEDLMTELGPLFTEFARKLLPEMGEYERPLYGSNSYRR